MRFNIIVFKRTSEEREIERERERERVRKSERERKKSGERDVGIIIDNE